VEKYLNDESDSISMKPKFLNLPDKITIFRLFLAIVSFVLMFMDRWISAFILIVVAIILDVVDGRVARRLKLVTTQGIFLDIMADKIVIISTFLVIGIKIDIIFFYLGILMLIREYIIDTMRAIAASKGKVITSDKFSKIKGAIFMMAMILMVGNYAFNNISFDATYAMVSNIAIIIASAGIIFSYITLIRFIILYKQTIE